MCRQCIGISKNSCAEGGLSGFVGGSCPLSPPFAPSLSLILFSLWEQRQRPEINDTYHGSHSHEIHTCCCAVSQPPVLTRRRSIAVHHAIFKSPFGSHVLLYFHLFPVSLEQLQNLALTCSLAGHVLFAGPQDPRTPDPKTPDPRPQDPDPRNR